MSKYEWYKSNDGYRWRLKASNGKIVSSDEGYKRKAGVLQGIAAHRRSAQTWRTVEVAE